MTDYNEEDFLALSGIQHFTFCRRQWALIHIEQAWKDNLLTVEGNILHERAHNSALAETRGDVIITRGMPVFSRTLGTNGVCDVVELHRNNNGVRLNGRDGLFLPVPVEYKRGKPKEGDEDVLQLAAQAICLGEMLGCDVPEGFLYYGEPSRRTRVAIDAEIKEKVSSAFAEMHELYARRYTPRVKPTKACGNCSLKDLCLPKLLKKRPVSEYLSDRIKEMQEDEDGGAV